MARIAVLDEAATLGILFHPAWRAAVNALIEAGIVVARRPVPQYPGAWGRLSLTARGVVELRFQTAKLSGRRLPMRLRQLPLFAEVA